MIKDMKRRLDLAKRNNDSEILEDFVKSCEVFMDTLPVLDRSGNVLRPNSPRKHVTPIPAQIEKVAFFHVFLLIKITET